MKLGLVEFLVRAQDDRDLLARAREFGAAGVEVIVTRAQLRDVTARRLFALRQAAAETGIAVPSLMLLDHNDGGIADRDEATAAAAREDVRAAIEWCAALGARVVLLPFFGRAELASEADLDRATEAFRQLCPQAAARGVRLCLEGTAPAERLRQMAADVGSAGFGCYMDLANAVWRGYDSPTEIRKLGELVAQVHVKDIWTGPGDCRPGRGRVDFAECARALEEIGYDGWLVLETPVGARELVRRDISFARSAFSRLPRVEPWPQWGAFSWEFGRGELDRLVELFRSCGLTTVQLAGPLLEEALASPGATEAMRDRLDASGLGVAALGAYRNLVAADPEVREHNIDFVKRCLRAAPALGTSVVATESGTRHAGSDWLPSPQNASEEAWQLLTGAIAELLPVAREHGSILAIEGYVHHVLRHPGQLLTLLDRFTDPQLQVVLDPYNYISRWVLPAQERVAAEFLERFEERFVLAHLKDVAPHGAEEGTPEFGMGVFPQRMYLDFLRRRRPDLPIILEHLAAERIPGAIARAEQLLRAES